MLSRSQEVPVPHSARRTQSRSTSMASAVCSDDLGASREEPFVKSAPTFATKGRTECLLQGGGLPESASRGKAV